MAREAANKDQAYCFDDEEMVWPHQENYQTLQDLLGRDGMYKFSKIKDRLEISTADLTKISREAIRQGVNTYSAYGFGKPKGSQYIVKMSLFRGFYSDYLKKRSQPTRLDSSEINEIPRAIDNANDLIKLSGYYCLKEICHYSPFKEHEEVIKHSVRSQPSQEWAKNQNGCWYDETKREFFIDMDLFVPWFFRRVWVSP